MIIAAVIIFIVIRNRRRKCSNGNIKVPTHAQHVTLNLNDLRNLTNGNGTTYSNGNNQGNGKLLSNGTMYNSIATSDLDDEGPLMNNGKIVNGDMYREPFDQIQGRRLPDLPPYKTPESTGRSYCNKHRRKLF